MTEQTNRPLITFAVFAYNQEKYVHDAVQGAFAQTYEPLEIILSDDCSADRTFNVMQEMAASYEGPHKIVLNRNKTNVGTIDHLLKVSKLASGALIVIAGGDDISKTHRTATIYKSWAETQANALYSESDYISEDGVTLFERVAIDPKKSFQHEMRGTGVPTYDGYYRNIPGYSAAYEKSAFDSIPLTNKRLLNEDSLMSYLININGRRIEYIRESLLFYRNPHAARFIDSSNLSASDLIDHELKICRFATSTYLFMDYLFDLLQRIGTEPAHKLTANLQQKKRRAELMSTFNDRTLIGKILAIITCRSLEDIRYCVPRTFGLGIFSFFKILFIRLAP
jgi:cellulose synthase/poly-beta-1,6-N-acetylglucosamine synthase-like glycosyltransferase